MAHFTRFDVCSAHEALEGDHRPKGNAYPSHRVLRDGVELYRGAPEACYAWLLHHERRSVNYATTYCGYVVQRLRRGETL